MQIGSVEIVFFIPGRCRKYDIGIQRRGIHAEVQVYHQIHLAGWRFRYVTHLRDMPFRHFGSDGIRMGPQVMFEEIFVTFGAGADGVTAPDKPKARPVLRCIRIIYREVQLPTCQLVDHVIDDLRFILGALSLSFARQFHRAAVELRVKG